MTHRERMSKLSLRRIDRVGQHLRCIGYLGRLRILNKSLGHTSRRMSACRTISASFVPPLPLNLVQQAYQHRPLTSGQHGALESSTSVALDIDEEETPHDMVVCSDTKLGKEDAWHRPRALALANPDLCHLPQSLLLLPPPYCHSHRYRLSSTDTADLTLIRCVHCGI